MLKCYCVNADVRVEGDYGETVDRDDEGGFCVSGYCTSITVTVDVLVIAESEEEARGYVEKYDFTHDVEIGAELECINSVEELDEEDKYPVGVLEVERDLR